jgi:hypothetical protein
MVDRPPPHPALDGGSALQVALHGRQTMPDADLRAAIFERPLPPLPPSDQGSAFRRRIRMAEEADPSLAAHRTRGTLGYGGVGGGFDGGGGVGGGDGGG